MAELEVCGPPAVLTLLTNAIKAMSTPADEAAAVAVTALQEALSKAGACGDKQPAAKKPRKRSEYQQFTSDCLKGKGLKSFSDAPAAMKACAAQWRERKGKGAAQP